MHKVGALHATAKTILRRDFGQTFVETVEAHTTVFHKKQSLIAVLKAFYCVDDIPQFFTKEGPMSFGSLLF